MFCYCGQVDCGQGTRESMLHSKRVCNVFQPLPYPPPSVLLPITENDVLAAISIEFPNTCLRNVNLGQSECHAPHPLLR
jgi:hypothetical protein